MPESPRHETAEDLYRAEFFKVIDMAIEKLGYYFESDDIEHYKQLSSMILDEQYNSDIVSKYPELTASLEQELASLITLIRNKFRR